MSRTSWYPLTISTDSNDEWKTQPTQVPSPTVTLVSPASPDATSSYTTIVRGTNATPSIATLSQSSSQRHSLSFTEFADGKFVILEPIEASTLYLCKNKETQRDFVCKVCRVYLCNITDHIIYVAIFLLMSQSIICHLVVIGS
jgi:hypothetical protein